MLICFVQILFKDQFTILFLNRFIPMLHITSRFRALLVHLCLCLAFATQAQIVSSSCAYDQTFAAKYAKGSWNTAYAYLNAIDSSALSMQPLIEQSLHDTIMRCVAAVFNTNLPARDTIISQLDITQFEPIDLLRFELKFDTSHQWTNQFLSGNTTGTSNVFVNQLANQYGMIIEYAEYMPAWVTTHNAVARIRLASPYNTNAIARLMLMQAGVLFANSVIPMGDGNQIIYQKEADYKVLTFRYGWQTCPGGCAYQRDWRFRIFQDCSVEYVGSYGDVLLDAQDLVSTGQFQVYPNPTNQGVQIKMDHPDASGSYQISLSDLHGRAVMQQIQQINTNEALFLELNSITNGTYILRIENDHYVGTQKVTVLR
jgi:Secretion system C-terminal sorting domain